MQYGFEAPMDTSIVEHHNWAGKGIAMKETSSATRSRAPAAFGAVRLEPFASDATV